MFDASFLSSILILTKGIPMSNGTRAIADAIKSPPLKVALIIGKAELKIAAPNKADMSSRTANTPNNFPEIFSLKT